MTIVYRVCLCLVVGFWAGFCVISASAASSASDDTVFVIKPYLFTILGNQIGVGWQYASTRVEATQIGLTLYDDLDNSTSIIPQQDGDLFYAPLPIPACGFGKNVRYQVTGQSAPVRISEIPCGDSTDPVRFSFMADTQEGVDTDAVFAKQIDDFPSQAVLNGGDLVQTGDSLSDWIGFFKSMEPVGGDRVLFPAVGNHEYRNDLDVPFWEHFFRFAAKDAHYSYFLGAAQIIVLNSNFEDDPSQRDSQLPWLEEQLAVPSAWKIVYFHHPGYSVGFFNGPLAPKKEYLVVQQKYIPLFERYGVDLVMNGHIHLFETSLKNGVHYLIVGPAGGKMGAYGSSDPYKEKTEAVRSIVNLEASPGYLRAMSVSIDGKILDDLILKK